jgi:hypothetical protein
MSSFSKSTQAKEAASPGKSKFTVYLTNTIYLLTIVGVLAFLYQSIATSFFEN